MTFSDAFCSKAYINTFDGLFKIKSDPALPVIKGLKECSYFLCFLHIIFNLPLLSLLCKEGDK